MPFATISSILITVPSAKIAAITVSSPPGTPTSMPMLTGWVVVNTGFSYDRITGQLEMLLLGPPVCVVTHEQCELFIEIGALLCFGINHWIEEVFHVSFIDAERCGIALHDRQHVAVSDQIAGCKFTHFLQQK